ncbi:DNA-binding transcription factor yap1 [Basidiobolus ranarum]|uniref:DNA-binding transcription factor yap1 n=1 Tax=Basidiobolus ranarum TaxID=34480 RepID=A0ABR2WTT6_9FUNG
MQNTFIIHDPTNNTTSPFSSWDINPTSKKGKRGRRKKETAEDENSNSPKKPGRKKVSTAPISKRQMQNREAQRLFRERKTHEQDQLLDRINELERLHEKAQEENCQLKVFTSELQQTNDKLQTTLKNIKETSPNFEFKPTNLSYLASPVFSPSSTSMNDFISSPSVSMTDIRSPSSVTMDEMNRDTSTTPVNFPAMSPILPQTHLSLTSKDISPEDGLSQGKESIPVTSQIPLPASNNLPGHFNVDVDVVTPVDSRPNIKQEGLCNLQSSILSLNSKDENLSIEYVDLLVEELHELCKEMKQKAMISSEPFEFEWPCDEINSRMNKVHNFG